MTESNIAASKRIMAQLTERWPDLFNLKKPVPLAIGIHEALQEALPDDQPKQIGRVLVYWCNRPHYLKALAAGAERLGLAGAQGSVTEEQAADAATRLQELQNQFMEKQKAKKEAEKARAEEAKLRAEKKAQAAAAAEAKKARQAAALAAAAAPKAKPKLAEPPPPAKAAPVIVVKKRRFTPSPTDT